MKRNLRSSRVVGAFWHSHPEQMAAKMALRARAAKGSDRQDALWLVVSWKAAQLAAVQTSKRERTMPS